MGRYYKKPYNRRNYYRSRRKEPPIFDMLIEVIFGLIILVGTGIYKLISRLFQNRNKIKGLFRVNEDNVEVLGNSLQTQKENQHLKESLNSFIEKTELTPMQTEKSGRYSLKESLITDAESEFLEVLKQVVEDKYKIESQVQLSRLIMPKDTRGGYTNYSDFNKIKAKSVDFVLFDNRYKPVLVIELDDRSHFRWDRIKRDQFVNDLMGEVGLRILRIPVSYSYDQEDLRKKIFS